MKDEQVTICKRRNIIAISLESSSLTFIEQPKEINETTRFALIDGRLQIPKRRKVDFFPNKKKINKS